MEEDQNQSPEHEITVEEDQKDFVLEDVEISQDSRGDFSYKEVSEMSEATEESLPDGLNQMAGATELENYQRLLEHTKQKLKIIDKEQADTVSVTSQKVERSDEFLRNFFIKFGMKKTLDSF